MIGGRKLGLVVNVAKCEIITVFTDDIDELEKFRNIAPDIKHVKPIAPIAPIGGEQSVDEVLIVKLDELRRLSNRVSQLHAHDAFFC